MFQSNAIQKNKTNTKTKRKESYLCEIIFQNAQKYTFKINIVISDMKV